MIIPDNVSVTDFTITKTGSVDNLVSIIEAEGFSGITADISGVNVQSFWNNSFSFSNSLRLDRRKIVSLKDPLVDEEIDVMGFAFDESYSDDFDSPDL